MRYIKLLLSLSNIGVSNFRRFVFLLLPLLCTTGYAQNLECSAKSPDCLMYGACCEPPSSPTQKCNDPNCNPGFYPLVCVDPNCNYGAPFSPDPEPSTVTFPNGPAGQTPPNVAVSVPPSNMPGVFTSGQYNAVILARLVFREGPWVANSTDGAYGNLTHGVPGAGISVHVSVPTNWKPRSNGTLIVCDKSAHITSTYLQNQQQQKCRVYANGGCICDGRNWSICDSSNPIKPVMVAAAKSAAFEVKKAYTNTQFNLNVVGYSVSECVRPPQP